jgi:hypothetical protein
MKREQGPATPEEALKTLPMTDGQRDMLTIGLYQIRNEMLECEGLARASSNLKQRMLALKLARTALANLTKALKTPFKNDLLEAMDEAWDGAYSDPRSMEFLKLLPVVKQAVDTMTADDIHERWNDGSDRRSVNQRCVDYETESVFDLVQKAGFALYEPDGQTLELMRRIFSYTGGKTVGTTSMVRKRLAAWKTPGKQNVYAFHNG